MKRLLPIFFLSFFLGGCSIYKMDINQGNILSNETIAKLKPGMSKDEVASLLGTPLLQDNFRSNRWDYVYFTNKRRAGSLKKSITLFFKDEKLVQQQFN